MNYSKIYDDLMSNRMILKYDRIEEKLNGVYFEGHHIIPKCKGGSGVSTKPKNSINIVLLTAREHFLAHWLLWMIYKDRQMALAFHKMLSTTKNTVRITSSRGYEEAREAFRVTNIGNTYSKGCTHIVTDEQRKNHSKIMKGKFLGDKNPFYNKLHSEESKEKIRKSRVGINKEKIWNYYGKKIVLKNDIVLGIFDTTKEVAVFINCSESNVGHVLGGTKKTAKGYVIKYEKNN